MHLALALPFSIAGASVNSDNAGYDHSALHNGVQCAVVITRLFAHLKYFLKNVISCGRFAYRT